jgi:hypothetical protein
MAENKTYTYKEKRGRSLFVPGYGTSDNKGVLVTTNPTLLENPNFEPVENEQPTPPNTEQSTSADKPVAPATPPVNADKPAATPPADNQAIKTETKENA